MTSIYPYDPPGTVQILVQASFLFLVNLFRLLAAKVFGAGLLGEIFAGLVYGPPLGNILESASLVALTDLGYLGLLGLVLRGGMLTDIRQVQSNLLLSIVIGMTGLLTPILLSLVLLHLVFGFTLLQAFTAGAALCSTSLGTTFVLIENAQLHKGRLGAVLASAALLDDVVGLILLELIESLGEHSAESIGWVIGRPILASVGLLAVSWVACRFAVLPVSRHICRLWPEQYSTLNHMAAIACTCFALVATSAFAGTSALLGIYVAGVVLSLVSSHLSVPGQPSIVDTFDSLFTQPLDYVLIPLFFASTRFSIPIQDMFSGAVLWQGIVYTLVCVFAKLVTGVWVPIAQLTSKRFGRVIPPKEAEKKEPAKEKPVSDGTESEEPSGDQDETHPEPADLAAQPLNPPTETKDASYPPGQPKEPPVSLLVPSLIVGFAMTARGEIGLLIANVARTASSGLMPDDLFIVTIWAILLCTFLGPVCLMWVVKRIEKGRVALPAEWVF